MVDMRDPWLMELIEEHSSGDIMAELLNMFSNIVEERIARPLPNHHDCVDWAFTKVHCHCCAQSD